MEERTITLQEFKDLVPIDNPDRDQVYGRFALTARVHKNTCAGVRVGDRVFFFEAEPDIGDPDVPIEFHLVGANVV